jgi:hypothetical protein
VIEKVTATPAADESAAGAGSTSAGDAATHLID